MKRNIAILIGVILAICVIFSIYKNSQEKILELPYPDVYMPAGESNNYFCEALVGTSIVSPVESMGRIKKGIRAKAFKGTDKISIEIEGDKLYFLTKASFEAGDTKDEEPFKIIYNDEHKLLAIDIRKAYLIVNVFALNKDTGIANWTKIRANGFLTGNPDTQSYCLKCEPR